VAQPAPQAERRRVVTAAAFDRPARATAWAMRVSRATVGVTATAFVATSLALLGSHAAVKVVMIALFVGAALLHLGLRGVFVTYPRLLGFFLALAVVSVLVAIVGLLNPEASPVAAIEGVRLYAVWGIAFIVLFTLLRSAATPRHIHNAFVLAAFLIALINGLAIADLFLGWGVISPATREAMTLVVGWNQEGVLRLDSVNIIALFVIVPYLLTLQVRGDAGRANSWVTRSALLVALVLAAVSGRRALWLVVALTPLTILALAAITRTAGALRPLARRAMVAYGLAGAAFLLAAPLRGPADEASFQRHLRTALSGSDERAIQVRYLLEGFAEAPVLGSGFGAHVGYRRSDERPWSYELTYVQLLFNAGVVGTSLLAAVFLTSFAQAVQVLRWHRADSAIPFAILVGVVSLLIGAYTNPYFGSFDRMFLVGLLPYLASFHSGFSA
jgi:hypothetical protein